MECPDSNVSIVKTSKNKVSAVGAEKVSKTIFFYEKIVKWCTDSFNIVDSSCFFHLSSLQINAIPLKCH